MAQLSTVINQMDSQALRQFVMQYAEQDSVFQQALIQRAQQTIQLSEHALEEVATQDEIIESMQIAWVRWYDMIDIIEDLENRIDQYQQDSAEGMLLMVHLLGQLAAMPAHVDTKKHNVRHFKEYLQYQIGETIKASANQDETVQKATYHQVLAGLVKWPVKRTCLEFAYQLLTALSPLIAVAKLGEIKAAYEQYSVAFTGEPKALAKKYEDKLIKQFRELEK